MHHFPGWDEHKKTLKPSPIYIHPSSRQETPTLGINHLGRFFSVPSCFPPVDFQVGCFFFVNNTLEFEVFFLIKTAVLEFQVYLWFKNENPQK